MKKGRRFYSPLLTLIVDSQQSSLNNSSQFCFIVPLKVDKRAVVRNRLKRKIRQFVKEYLERIKPGQRVIFMARAVEKRNRREQIKVEGEQLLRKAGLLQKR